MKVEDGKRLVGNALKDLSALLERGQSEVLKTYLAALGRFHAYSLNNSLLIAAQRPSATRVAGYSMWKRLGRRVRRGERGIMILAPLIARPRERSPPENEREDVKAEPDPDNVCGFRSVYVFDVNQTQGVSLPELTVVRGDPDSYIQPLKSIVANHGISLEYSARIAPAKGTASRGRIRLLPDLSPAEEFSTLVHELAHAVLHFGKETPKRSKRVLETEAEAVAYVVCTAVGLDTNSAASDYIQLWGGDQKTLARSLERIRNTALPIIQGISDEAVTPAQSAG
jgi:antirestriction protein ArdC